MPRRGLEPECERLILSVVSRAGRLLSTKTPTMDAALRGIFQAIFSGANPESPRAETWSKALHARAACARLARKDAANIYGIY